MMEFNTTNNNLVMTSDPSKAPMETSDEVFRSMKIDQESRTPYSDATQVRRRRGLGPILDGYIDKSKITRVAAIR